MVPKFAHKRHNREVKYKSDFVRCIEKVDASLHPHTSQVLVLEDDVILMRDFFSTLLSTINLHQHRLSGVPWLDIKLYKSARLRGWAWDWIPLTQLAAYSALLGIGALYI